MINGGGRGEVDGRSGSVSLRILASRDEWLEGGALVEPQKEFVAFRTTGLILKY